MIFGSHMVVVDSKDAAADQAFLRDVLGLTVDAGHGRLIFTLPPSEVAIHPAEQNSRRQLYFMCHDLNAEISALKERSVRRSDVHEEHWCSIVNIQLPGGGEIGLYQSNHPTAFSDLSG